MRAVRVLLMAAGVAAALWGVWLARGFRADQIRSALEFLVGGVVVHDAVLAPLTVVAGVLLVRVVPPYAKAVAVVCLVLWGTVTVAVVNVLSGEGGKPDNDTVLNRPYLLSWIMLTAVVAVVGVVVSLLRRTGRRPIG